MAVDVADVLPPPNLRAFGELARADPDQIEVVTSGWTKFVLLTSTRAYLLPRFPDHVQPLRFEAEVLESLAPLGLPFVPRLFGSHEKMEIWPFPFLELSRMPGVVPADTMDHAATARLMTAVGEALGRLHDVPTGDLPGPLDRERLSGHFLADDFASQAAERVGAIVTLPPRTAQRWSALFAPLVALEPVFTHGEFGDSQLLHVDGQLSAVLDWDAAGPGPPLVDLGFFEWGSWLHRRQRHFNKYRRNLWRGYASSRGSDLAELGDAFVILCAVRDVLWHLDHPDPPPWVDLGTISAAIDNLEGAASAAR